MKNKTLAAWAAFMGGPLGLHRFYLFGVTDILGWLLPMPSLLGLYGIRRAQLYGLDDPWIWLLIPLLGFTFSACALNAIVYGLMSTDKWNRRFNPGLPADAPSGQTGWLTIAAVVAALLVGTTALMSSLAFGFQRYFEYQVEDARQLSQPDAIRKSAD
jgi:hypothetical protein